MKILTEKMRLLQNTILLMGSMVLLRVFSAATTIVLTHWLTLEDYGRFSYGQSVALLLMFGVSVGLPTFIVKDLAGKTENAAMLLTSCLKLIVFLTLIECTVVGAIFLFGGFPQGLAGTVIPMSIGGGALAGNMVMQAFFRAYDRFALQATLLSLQGVMMLVILLTVAKLFDSSAAVAWAFAGSTGFIFSVHLAFTIRITGWSWLSQFQFTELLRKTISFGLIDWIMAGYPLVVGTGLLLFKGAAEVGIFYAGFAVFGAISIMALVLDQIFIREILRSDRGQQIKIARTYIAIAFVAGVSAGAIVFFSAGLLASLFFAETQPMLVLVLQMFSFALAFRFVGMASSSFERLNGAQNKILLIHFTGLCLLMLVMPWALQWGLVGGAAAMVILELCLAIVFVFRTYFLGKTLCIPLAGKP
ncbi:hypothetical protein [Kiloniella antarctica]|uniref:Polysaccharide biosynthesis protein C-terminal domain-containing protein n=1 Tax=Kiloniella antarctica TaxID=1550907 RepID=A0ABW5BJJ1_9PROT